MQHVVSWLPLSNVHSRHLLFAERAGTDDDDDDEEEEEEDEEEEHDDEDTEDFEDSAFIGTYQETITYMKIVLSTNSEKHIRHFVS